MTDKTDRLSSLSADMRLSWSKNAQRSTHLLRSDLEVKVTKTCRKTTKQPNPRNGICVSFNTKRQ